MRRGGRVAVIGVLFIMAAVVAAVLAVMNTDRIVSLNMRASQVRESAYRLDSAYFEVVGAEYASLLTSDPQAIERFRASLAPVAAHLKRLDELVVDPGQRQLVGSIARILDERLADARQVVDLLQSGKRDEAVVAVQRALVSGDQNQVRNELLKFIDANRAVLLTTERSYRNATRLQLIMGAAAVLAVLFFGVNQVLSTYQHLRHVADSRRGLSEANERLEVDVAKRTLELAGAVQRFQVALRAANVTVFSQDANRVFNWVSGDLFGMPVEKVLGRREEDLLPTEVSSVVIPAKQSVLETGKPQDYQYSVDVAGARRWFRVRAEPTLDEAGKPVGLIGAVIDLTGEKAVQQQLAQVSDELRTTLQRFEVVLKGADITVFAQDRNLAYTWVSSDFEDWKAGEFIGRTDTELFKPDLARKLVEMKREVLATGDSAGGEFRVEGQTRETWQLVRIEPQRDDSGAIVGILGVRVDVTERRQRETHNRILLRELTHRTKNLLAVVQAMARQTLTTSVSARDFEARFSGRLQGLASSLDILVNENWQGAAVADLVRTQLVYWKDIIGSRIRLSGDDVRLEPEAAQNIGLALHELSTNSAKYGALSAPGGVIDIGWTVEPADAVGPSPGRFVFTWRESNGPLVSPPQHKGFGHAVIERLVPRALNGRAQLDYAETGFSWRLDIPLAMVRAPDAEPTQPKVWEG